MSQPLPLEELLTRIEAIIFDCDGVLSCGGLFYSAKGVELLRFDAKDSYGIAAFCRLGHKAAVLSGRPIDIAKRRFAELGVEAFVGPCRDKRQGVKDLCSDLGVALENTAFVGDDLADLGALRTVGLPIAVADARPEIMDVARWVTKARGGHGAAREVCETILKAKGLWQTLVGSA